MEKRNHSEHLRYRYGICLNEKCSKCDSKEVQPIGARKEFVCTECGKPLRECPPPKSWWDKHGKMVISIAVIAVVCIVIALYFLTGNNRKEPAQVAAVPADTAQTAPQPIKEPADTIKAKPTSADSTQKDSVKVKPQKDNQKTERPVTPIKVKLRCGKYDGPQSGGKAHGVGGTITVTRSYTINLKDGYGGTVVVRPGDKIMNTKFEHGVLKQGQIIFSNGERKFLTGISERL